MPTLAAMKPPDVLKAKNAATDFRVFKQTTSAAMRTAKRAEKAIATSSPLEVYVCACRRVVRYGRAKT